MESYHIFKKLVSTAMLSEEHNIHIVGKKELVKYSFWWEKNPIWSTPHTRFSKTIFMEIQLTLCYHKPARGPEFWEILRWNYIHWP